MHACCKEGVASNRCVKLPTMSPLSHLWIDGLRGAEVRVREFGPLWHLHAFCCKHCGSVLGFPNTLCSGWRSFQLPEKLCAHLRSTGMDLRQTLCPGRPASRWRQSGCTPKASRGTPKTQSSFPERQLHHSVVTPLETGMAMMSARQARRWLSRFWLKSDTSEGGKLRRMWFALGPPHIKRSNHALCTSCTAGILESNCKWDPSLSASHFCTKAWSPTGTPSTTRPLSSSSLSPFQASSPMTCR